MSSIIYLIGGGEIRNGDTLPIDLDIMTQVPKGSTLVFIGFASRDNTDYANAVTSVYRDKYTVIVPTEAKGREFAIEAIRSADVIYLGGGDTEHLLRVFTKWGIVEYLRYAVSKGVCVAGMSAGAQILSKWYIHKETDKFELREGLGIVPLGVLVHANEASLDAAKLLWSKSDASRTYDFVAIGEGAARRVGDSEASKLGSGKSWNIPARS